MTLARQLSVGALLLALSCAGCGSGPAAPSLPAAFALSAGPHMLTVSVWHSTHTNPYGFTSTLLVCTGSGPTSLSVPVVVTREGASWMARAESGTLMLTLADAAADHQGAMFGSATVGDVTVAVHDGGTLDGPASLPPGAASTTSIGGRIEGAVRFITSGGEQSCSNNAWALSRR